MAEEVAQNLAPAVVPAEKHAEHPWFDPAHTYWNGKEPPEQVRAAVEMTIASGRVSREDLLGVMPQSDNLHAGSDAPAVDVYTVDGERISIASHFDRAPITILNFGSYT